MTKYYFYKESAFGLLMKLNFLQNKNPPASNYRWISMLFKYFTAQAINASLLPNQKYQ